MVKTVNIDQFEQLTSGETLRVLRKQHLKLTLAEVAARIGKSLSFVQQVETNIRVLTPDDINIIVDLFPLSENRKEINDCLVQKSALKKCETYGDILKDQGKFLSVRAIQMVQRDYKAARTSFRALGLHLDMQGPQVKKMLLGEMALNKKQVLALAKGLNQSPEKYLNSAGYLTDSLHDLIVDCPEIFIVLDKYKKNKDDPLFVNHLQRALEDLVKEEPK